MLLFFFIDNYAAIAVAFIIKVMNLQFTPLRFALVALLAINALLGCTNRASQNRAVMPRTVSQPVQHVHKQGCPYCAGLQSQQSQQPKTQAQTSYRPVNPYPQQVQQQTHKQTQQRPVTRLPSQQTSARPLSLLEQLSQYSNPQQPNLNRNRYQLPSQKQYARNSSQNTIPRVPESYQLASTEAINQRSSAARVVTNQHGTSQDNTNQPKYFAPVGDNDANDTAPQIRQAANVEPRLNKSPILQVNYDDDDVYGNLPSLGTPPSQQHAEQPQIHTQTPSRLQSPSNTSPNVTTPAVVPNVNQSVAPPASPELNQPWNVERNYAPRIAAAPQTNPFFDSRSTNVSGYAPDDSVNNSNHTNRNASVLAPLNGKSTVPMTDNPRSQHAHTTRANNQQEKTLSAYVPKVSIGKKIVSEFSPSTDRTWGTNYQLLPKAEFNGDKVTIRNIRYTVYRQLKDFTTRYYDQTFDLSQIQTLDFISAPFSGVPSIAHIEASFGFADGRHVAISVEPRYEEGESYDPLGSITNQFELIYVVADERDLIRLYTQINKSDVYLFRLKVTPTEIRHIFEGMLGRANKLANKPEFYHAISNNCATNLIAHINAARPNAIPRDYRSRFPGRLDKLLYDRGLLQNAAADFKTTKENAKINWLAEKFGDIDYFSAGIRQHLY
ncbi:MAG: DUF4105 domain-containing protein [Planctomycetaceae bacterium]|nr:DUF4105 domain-containing protein [Planctomycetaceae bacterium]